MGWGSRHPPPKGLQESCSAQAAGKQPQNCARYESAPPPHGRRAAGAAQAVHQNARLAQADGRAPKMKCPRQVSRGGRCFTLPWSQAKSPLGRKLLSSDDQE